MRRDERSPSPQVSTPEVTSNEKSTSAQAPQHPAPPVVQRPTGVAPQPLRCTPGTGSVVLAELRAADARLGMRTPAAPECRPDRETVLRLLRAHVRQVRFYATQYDSVADDVEAIVAVLVALAPLAELLAVTL